MAEKYLTYTGLKEYDRLLKNWSDTRFGGTIKGYYHNGHFYEYELHADEDFLIPKENYLYVDLSMGDNKLYMYNGSEYELVSDSGSAEIDLAETTVACGGITKGTDLTGKSLQEILEMMLSPYVAPSSISLSISKSKSGYIEYGDTCQLTQANIRWTNGSVPVSSIELRLDGSDTIIGTATPASGDASAPIDFTDMTLSTTPIKFNATFKVNGHNDINVSTTASNNFVYPIYYGSSSVTADNLVASDIQSAAKVLSSGTQTYSYTVTDGYPMIASPRKLTKVTDNSGITDYTNAFIGSETEISLSSVSPAWGPVTYYVYTGSRATLDAFQFKFTF